MSNETKNFEIDIKTKQIKYLTDDELKENEKKRIKKIREAKFVQHIPLFKRLILAVPSNDCIRLRAIKASIAERSKPPIGGIMPLKKFR